MASCWRSARPPEHHGAVFGPYTVADYLENSRINILFLPLYSRHLNLIERFWKFFQRQVHYSRYYEAFKDYENACQRFFRELDSYAL